MCGICGFVGSRQDEVLRIMKRALAHRGPDGDGEFHNDAAGVHLGHRRLAIIDLDGGLQPMSNEDGSIVVVYNGEIYNHVELRAELEREGHRFKTDHSDTEVLVHGYKQWGQHLALRLNGMFAFAIFDAKRRRLFLARDRFGEKPLYWAHGPGFFAFASELRSLGLHPAIHGEVDVRALQKFFAHGYVPAPNSLLAGTSKLPGGCHLTYDIEAGSATVARYWRFSLEPDESLTDLDESRLAEELRALVIQAVRRRLISDVPLGLFLSGGIDSSCILAAASHLLPADSISTFHIGFTERSFDESAAASQTASFFGSRHHEKRLDIQLARDLIDSALDRLDEPLGDASILPTILLAAFARGHVKVALSGDGGDELFAGYDPFVALRPAEIYSRIVPRPLHQFFRRVVNLLPRAAKNMSLDFKLRRTLMGLSYPRKLWNPVWLAPLEPEAIADLFRHPLSVEDLYSEALAVWDTSTCTSLVDRTLEFYTNLYLQDDILMKVDRAAMMSSLESRAVFLDNDLVAFCQRLPNRFKFRNGERKYLLRKAMGNLLPRSVLRRAKKGFGVPLATWLRTVPAEVPMRALADIRLPWVETCWREHRAGRADHRMFLWSWLALQHTPSLKVWS